MLLDGGKPADSLPWFDRAIGALTKVRQKAPRIMTTQKFLRNSHWNRALAYDELGKHAEAVKDWTQAVEFSPPGEQPDFRVRRAYSLVRAGGVAEAIAEVAELRKSTKVLATQWYYFARIYVVASDKDAGKKQEYVDNAMRMLRYAVQAGYKDSAYIEKDKTLEVLRQREDYKKLLRSLARPKEKAPGEPR
jgi:tetratricopeptide (TPR) repeat protein